MASVEAVTLNLVMHDVDAEQPECVGAPGAIASGEDDDVMIDRDQTWFRVNCRPRSADDGPGDDVDEERTGSIGAFKASDDDDGAIIKHSLVSTAVATLHKTMTR